MSVWKAIDKNTEFIDEKFTMNKMNTVFYRFLDHTYKYYKLEEVEKYVRFEPTMRKEAVNPKTGLREKTSEVFKIRDCTVEDFN